MTNTAKRRLKDFDFTQDNAHVALVHKAQGGGANGRTTLLMKSNVQRSEEFIKKASKVQVTLSLPDFLEKFFGVWGNNATLLATMFGYNPSDEKDSDTFGTESFWDWWRKECEAKGAVDHWGDATVRPTDEDKQRWAKEQLNSVEILKSAQDNKGSAEWLATLDEDQYLGLLKDQQFIEKHFFQKEGNGSEPTENVNESTEAQVDVNKKADTAIIQENEMTTKTEGVVVDTTEDILKAKDVELQKALADIQKMKEQLDIVKQREVEQLMQARLDTLTSAVVDVEKAEVLMKAVGALDAEEFDSVVEVLKGLTPKATKPEMFEEKGSPNEGVDVSKSSLLQIMTKKYQTK